MDENVGAGKLLVIIGPTGVGKSALGLVLAKKYNGDILSADSRQVYRGMNIVTGKDLSDGVRIWLMDLVGPREEFSVAHWKKTAIGALEKIRQDGKLPIVVGGTGLYVKALVDGIETIDVPRNEESRKSLLGKTASELFEILAQFDSVRAANMNQSDRKNPRRLVRAIEVASWGVGGGEMGMKVGGVGGDLLMIGLNAPKEVLNRRIGNRVDKRMKTGALDEVKKLLDSGVSWDDQAMSGIGYRELRGYFEGKVSLEESVKRWKTAERKYAKRQLTWFKKDKRVRWFNIDEDGWRQKVEKLIGSWYNNGDAEES